MMYSTEELRSKEFDHNTAMQRYLHKYLNQKKDFRKLKAHEKDYAFGWMKVTYNKNGEKAFNLYEEPMAFEYLFYNIILTYGEDVDSFSGVYNGPYGTISNSQMLQDKKFFMDYLSVWKDELNTHKGKYLSIIAPMVRQKLKEISAVTSSNKERLSREIYCYSVFFYIYYKAKLYFDEKRNKALIFNANGFVFVGNIYTFCHILSRHYIPSLNRELDNTMNEMLSIIKIDGLMDSIRNLILNYFSVCPTIQATTEYLLFKLEGFCYILWIKYKPLDEISKEKGFEIRSFYKCSTIKDLSLFNNTTDIVITEDIVCSVPNKL